MSLSFPSASTDLAWFTFLEMQFVPFSTILKILQLCPMKTWTNLLRLASMAWIYNWKLFQWAKNYLILIEQGRPWLNSSPEYQGSENSLEFWSKSSRENAFDLAPDKWAAWSCSQSQTRSWYSNDFLLNSSSAIANYFRMACLVLILASHCKSLFSTAAY
jgi:hypothetical protein